MKKLLNVTEEEKNRILEMHNSKRTIQEQSDSRVVAIQNALIQKGYDVGKKGADGIIGQDTKNAIIKFQKANGIQQTGYVGSITSKALGVEPPTTSTQKSQSNLKTSGDKKKSLSGEKSTGVIQTSKTPLNINLPLHHYAALRFLAFNKNPLTESEINQETLNNISEVLCEKSARMKTCDPSKWLGKDPRGNPNKNSLGYNDYTTLFSKSPSYKKKSFNYQDQPMSIAGPMLTFGRATITGGPGGWVINDTYNFDNILENKRYLKTDNFLQMGINVVIGLGHAALNWLTGHSAVAGIEEAMSQLHNLGYQGYKTEVKIPVNGCKCKY